MTTSLEDTTRRVVPDPQAGSIGVAAVGNLTSGVVGVGANSGPELEVQSAVDGSRLKRHDDLLCQVYTSSDPRDTATQAFQSTPLTSTRRSNAVLVSPLFFRPIQTSSAVGFVFAVPAHVPTSAHGLPLLKLIEPESFCLAVVAVGLTLFRTRVEVPSRSR